MTRHGMTVLEFRQLAGRAKAERWPDVIGADALDDEFEALDRIGAQYTRIEIQKTAEYKALVKGSRGVEALRKTALAAMQGLAWAAHVREPHMNTMVVYVGQTVATALLKRDLRALQAFVDRMAALGLLVRVSESRCFLPAAIERLRDVARRLSTADDGFTAAQFRDATGIGRNLAIDVLEYFDRRGITRRFGDKRRVTSAEGMSRLPGDKQ